MREIAITIKFQIGDKVTVKNRFGIGVIKGIQWNLWDNDSVPHLSYKIQYPPSYPSGRVSNAYRSESEIFPAPKEEA